MDHLPKVASTRFRPEIRAKQAEEAANMVLDSASYVDKQNDFRNDVGSKSFRKVDVALFRLTSVNFLLTSLWFIYDVSRPQLPRPIPYATENDAFIEPINRQWRLPMYLKMKSPRMVGMANQVGRVRIMGAGRKSGEIEAWCAEVPTRRRTLGFAQRVRIVEQLAVLCVLNVFSGGTDACVSRKGPPTSGKLSADLTIDTTDEAKRGHWLKSHGQHVLPALDFRTSFPKALDAALSSPSDHESDTNQLLSTHGRCHTDDCPHNEESHVETR